MQKNIDALLRLPEVSRLTGLSRSALYARIARGEFPAPVKLGPRASRWRLSAIQLWMDGLKEGCK
jgi:prophage regulatory protein